MSAHTPGPWQIVPYWDGDDVVNVVAEYSERIEDGRTIKVANWIAELDAAVDFDDEDDRREETYANARLIAAAPDLLEACKLAVSRMGMRNPTAAVLNAAIDKAEGR